MDEGVDIEGWHKKIIEVREKNAREYFEKNKKAIESFIDLVYKKGIKLDETHFSYVETTGVVATFPNLLEIIDADLKRDKEGLISTKIIKEKYMPCPMMGSYRAEGYALLVHPFFRRGHHEVNHFPPSFISKFCSIFRQEIETTICLDYNRIQIGFEPYLYLEEDAWYGPKFQHDVAKIDDGNAKLAPPSDLEPASSGWLFGKNYSLIINWNTYEGIKSFYAKAFRNEEVTIENSGETFYPVQYLHAEYDLEKNYFRHLDGALHLHTFEEYLQTRDLDFNHREKIQKQIKPRSHKLFKLNGKIDQSMWSDLVGEYLSGNPLIIEYMTGELPARTIESISKIRNRNK